MRKVVGIDRKIKRAWVDAVLDRLTQTTDQVELRTFLDEHLKEELPGKQSRAKSAGIILRIWSGVPPERVSLRDRAVAMLPRISGQERIWLHWGMAALAYPFFRDTTEVVGRLLSLQDDFTTAQVQGRMLTTWGDRATSKEAAQKLITTLVDWEVLRSTKTKGHFLLARRMTASIPELQLWLLEALLAASESEEIEAQQLLRLPESFPFTISVGVADLRRHEGFNIHRQGLDMDMVSVHEPRLKAIRPKKEPHSTRTRNKSAQASLFSSLSGSAAAENGKPSLANARTREPQRLGHLQDQNRIEESIKGEFLGTLTDRVKRFLQVRGTTPPATSPFAALSLECAKQFRDGHYFGCIALAQVGLEAIIRHVWQVKFKKMPTQEGAFPKNLESLRKRDLISDDWKSKLDQMWADRHWFLPPFARPNQDNLESMARTTLLLFNDLEREFFSFTLKDGVLMPDHPEYWPIKQGASVFRRDNR